MAINISDQNTYLYSRTNSKYTYKTLILTYGSKFRCIQKTLSFFKAVTKYLPNVLITTDSFDDVIDTYQKAWSKS